MIEYRTDMALISADDLDGFFVRWPSHPDPATHLRMLEGAWAVALAVEPTQAASPASPTPCSTAC